MALCPQTISSINVLDVHFLILSAGSAVTYWLVKALGLWMLPLPPCPPCNPPPNVRPVPPQWGGGRTKRRSPPACLEAPCPCHLQGTQPKMALSQRQCQPPPPPPAVKSMPLHHTSTHKHIQHSWVRQVKHAVLHVSVDAVSVRESSSVYSSTPLNGLCGEDFTLFSWGWGGGTVCGVGWEFSGRRKRCTTQLI